MKNKLYVPLLSNNINADNRPSYVESLRKCEADFVFIALDRETFFAPDKKAFDHLRENIDYFEENGFGCSVWMQAFGFGATEKNHLIPKGKYTKIKSVLGEELTDAFCPECENYMNDYLDWIERVAKSGAKMIMIDDDLCLSVRPGLGCFCKNHIKILEDKLGETLDGKDLTKLFFTGKPNKYRKAWIETQKDSLLKFAKKVRERIDEVDPSIRAGFCAGYTSWDIEGADAIEVTGTLAGNTEPFLRFTGAPYWVTKTINRFPGQHLSSVIEMTRMQEVWCRDSGIEVFAEADSYPRPRYNVASSYIECFDAAITASGGMGDLKYVLEYYSHPSNEQGYVKRHIKNKPLREFLQKNFDGKTDVGVQIAERMHKFADMTLPEEFAGENMLMYTAHSPAAAMLAPLSIPCMYETNSDVCIAFNNNVDMLKELPKKLITDINGAKILMQKGIDMGLVSAKETEIPIFEHFHNVRTPLFANAVGTYYDCELKNGTKVLNSFENGKGMFPAAYTYKNGNNEFYVLTFDAYTPPYNSSLFVSYGRQEQLIDFIGNKYCYIKNEPGVYQICKKSETQTAVFFENIWEDSLFDFDISLDGEYKSVEFFGAEGYFDGDKLHITSEIAPYGMFAVVLNKF